MSVPSWSCLAIASRAPCCARRPRPPHEPSTGCHLKHCASRNGRANGRSFKSFSISPTPRSSGRGECGLILAEDRPQLTGYDQDLWAERLHYGRPIRRRRSSCLTTLRSANLRLVENASPADLKRVGVHLERGEESLEHLCRLYAGHDLLHLAADRTRPRCGRSGSAVTRGRGAALGSRGSALSVLRSAFYVLRSTFCVLRSTFGVRRSAPDVGRRSDRHAPILDAYRLCAPRR